MDKLIICAGIPGFSQRMARTAFITKLCQLRKKRIAQVCETIISEILDSV
jgi:hypothetical protein